MFTTRLPEGPFTPEPNIHGTRFVIGRFPHHDFRVVGAWDVNSGTLCAYVLSRPGEAEWRVVADDVGSQQEAHDLLQERHPNRSLQVKGA